MRVVRFTGTAAIVAGLAYGIYKAKIVDGSISLEKIAQSVFHQLATLKSSFSEWRSRKFTDLGASINFGIKNASTTFPSLTRTQTAALFVTGALFCVGIAVLIARNFRAEKDQNSQGGREGQKSSTANAALSASSNGQENFGAAANQTPNKGVSSPGQVQGGQSPLTEGGTPSASSNGQENFGAAANETLNKSASSPGQVQGDQSSLTEGGTPLAPNQRYANGSIRYQTPNRSFAGPGQVLVQGGREYDSTVIENISGVGAFLLSLKEQRPATHAAAEELFSPPKQVVIMDNAVAGSSITDEDVSYNGGFGTPGGDTPHVQSDVPLAQQDQHSTSSGNEMCTISKDQLVQLGVVAMEHQQLLERLKEEQDILGWIDELLLEKTNAMGKKDESFASILNDSLSDVANLIKEIEADKMKKVNDALNAVLLSPIRPKVSANGTGGGVVPKTPETIKPGDGLQILSSIESKMKKRAALQGGNGSKSSAASVADLLGSAGAGGKPASVQRTSSRDRVFSALPSRIQGQLVDRDGDLDPLHNDGEDDK